jgi:hypothetical protein
MILNLDLKNISPRIIYRTLNTWTRKDILSVSFYGSKNFALRTEHNLQMFKNKVLIRILSPKKNEISEKFKILRYVIGNIMIYILYLVYPVITTPKSKRLTSYRHDKKAYRILVEKALRKW